MLVVEAPTEGRRRTTRMRAAVAEAMAELAGRAVIAGIALWVSAVLAACHFLQLLAALDWAVVVAEVLATIPPAILRPVAALRAAASFSFEQAA